MLLNRLVNAAEVDGEERLLAKELLLIVVEKRDVAVIDANFKVFAMFGEREHFLLRVGVVARE